MSFSQTEPNLPAPLFATASPGIAERSTGLPATDARFPTLEEASAAVDELRETYPDVPRLERCDQERLLGALYQPVQSVGGRDAYPSFTLKLAVLVCGLVK